MPIHLYALLTWTTRERQPVITREVEQFLREMFPRVCRAHGAELLAMGFQPDQIHLVLQLGARLDIPTLAQKLKGASAKIATRDGVAATDSLRWANGYDLRSVGVSGLPQVIAYVQNQADPHGIGQGRAWASARD